MTAYPRAEMRAVLHPRCAGASAPRGGEPCRTLIFKKVLGEVKAGEVRGFNREVQSAF